MFGAVTSQELATLRRQTERWLPVAVEIAHAHGLPTDAPKHFSGGTNLVASFGDAILKLFPPFLREQFEAERLTLPLLHGKLSVPSPRLIAEGEREGWTWLALTKLEGEPGDEIWPTLSEGERERLLERVGGLIAEVQRVPAGPLLSLGMPWPAFLDRQIANCRARQERTGLPAHLLADLDNYLATTLPLVPREIAPVILTGEFIPQNLLLRCRTDGWHLESLIDFGDAMPGFGEYDLLGPCVFMSAGAPSRLEALMRGYGCRFDRDLARRLGAMMLLHKHSNLKVQIAVDDWPAKAATLCDLERLIWPL